MASLTVSKGIVGRRVFAIAATSSVWCNPMTSLSWSCTQQGSLKVCLLCLLDWVEGFRFYLWHKCTVLRTGSQYAAHHAVQLDILALQLICVRHYYTILSHPRCSFAAERVGWELASRRCRLLWLHL
jgi:hypothetical protein